VPATSVCASVSARACVTRGEMNEVILATSMPDEDAIGSKRREKRERERERERRCDAADIKRTRYGAEVAITTASCSLARGEITKEHCPS